MRHAIIIGTLALATALGGAALAATPQGQPSHFGTDGFGGPATSVASHALYRERTVQTETLRRVACASDRTSACFAG
jgi:hypothetical protein